jgi:hypothetical protein
MSDKARPDESGNYQRIKIQAPNPFDKLREGLSRGEILRPRLRMTKN